LQQNRHETDIGDPKHNSLEARSDIAPELRGFR
jgi:hypothetical protein